MYYLNENVKIINMLNTYVAQLSTPATISTPIGGTIVDTKGYKNVLFIVNLSTVGTNASWTLKFQHTVAPGGGTPTDITNSIVNGALGTAAFTAVNLSQAYGNVNGKMSLRVNDGTLQRYIVYNLATAGTHASSGVVSIVAILSGADSVPHAMDKLID